MSNKKVATKLVIVKNQADIDADNLLTYSYTFYNNDIPYLTHIERVQVGRDPILDEWLDHKLNCCYSFDKDQLIVEETIIAPYTADRKSEYPPMEDFLDAWVKNDADALNKYRADCLAVKQKYPKPE